MRLFLKNTILFILPLIAFFAFGIVGTNVLIDKNGGYEVPVDRNIIILGHSHSACAFNDSLLPGFYNLSQTTEGYPYTYYKAKKIFEENSHIKLIFLEYTNNQITPWAYNRIYGKYIGVNMNRMLPVIGKGFALANLKKTNNPVKMLEVLKNSLSLNVKFLYSGSSSYLEERWHNHITPNHVYDGEIPTVKSNEAGLVFRDCYSVEEDNIRYLVMIKQLCLEYDVELVLIRSPILFDNNYTNELVFQDIRKKYFSDNVFLDFVNYPLPREFYSDLNHLNAAGRDRFTNEFKIKVIDAGLLNSPDVEQMVLEMSN